MAHQTKRDKKPAGSLRKQQPPKSEPWEPPFPALARATISHLTLVSFTNKASKSPQALLNNEL